MEIVWMIIMHFVYFGICQQSLECTRILYAFSWFTYRLPLMLQPLLLRLLRMNMKLAVEVDEHLTVLCVMLVCGVVVIARDNLSNDNRETQNDNRYLLCERFIWLGKWWDFRLMSMECISTRCNRKHNFMVNWFTRAPTTHRNGQQCQMRRH